VTLAVSDRLGAVVENEGVPRGDLSAGHCAGRAVSAPVLCRADRNLHLAVGWGRVACAGFRWVANLVQAYSLESFA